jgi:hypothetical protein
MKVTDDDSERVVSYKEAARMRQRAAYQKAKAERAKDPRYLAMKQAAKEQRRAAYQEAKQRHKAQVEKVKRQRAAEEEERRAQARAKADAQLLELVTWLGKGSSAQN